MINFKKNLKWVFIIGILLVLFLVEPIIFIIAVLGIFSFYAFKKSYRLFNSRKLGNNNTVIAEKHISNKIDEGYDDKELIDSHAHLKQEFDDKVIQEKLKTENKGRIIDF